ncbi:MAG: TA system VapC family ribonuclease toxin [Burkholderiales bacterium]
MISARILPDVNVWVALLDEAHVHNAKALALMKRRGLRIATCPLIENGVLRVLNLPGYSAFGPLGFQTVRDKLASICKRHDHEFWPDDVTLRTNALVDWSRVLGHNQITDVYLLALAVTHGGCLATLDQRVALATVPSAKESHLLLL